MRSHENVFERRELRIAARFLLKTVEPHRSQLAGCQGFDQRVLIHQIAPRRVDKNGPVREAAEGFSGHNPTGPIGHGTVERQEVRGRKQALERIVKDGTLFELRRQSFGIMVVDLHVESTGALRHDPADTAQAKNAETLSGGLHADQKVG